MGRHQNMTPGTGEALNSHRFTAGILDPVRTIAPLPEAFSSQIMPNLLYKFLDLAQIILLWAL